MLREDVEHLQSRILQIGAEDRAGIGALKWKKKKAWKESQKVGMFPEAELYYGLSTFAFVAQRLLSGWRRGLEVMKAESGTQRTNGSPSGYVPSWDRSMELNI